jgi:transcriptional regulator with XRE-family HTH domain
MLSDITEVSTMFRIRETRNARGLTQAELAKAAHIDQGHLSRIERGQADVYLCTLRRIAGALNVPLVALLDDEDERQAA